MRLCLALPMVSFAAAALFAEPAQAGRGLLLITHGDAIKHVADLSPEMAKFASEEMGHDGVKLGYKYDHFGLFWLDLWTWDGEYCLYAGDTYWSLPPDAAAQIMEQPVESLGTPFLYKFPLGLMILLGLGGAFAAYTVLTRNKQGAAPVAGEAQADADDNA